MRLTPLRRRLLAVALGALAALALAELALRLLAGDGIPLQVQWPTAVEEVDQRAGRSTRDSYATFSYDEQGFRRGSGLPFEHSVLFIGDSFTEGRGVGDEQTFARAAERALRGPVREHLTFSSASTPGVRPVWAGLIGLLWLVGGCGSGSGPTDTVTTE
jgi:hypothetical protein